MNQRINRICTPHVSRILLCFIGIAISVLQLSCHKMNEGNKHIIIRVDMSKEHDSGIFKPGDGDKVFVAGNFDGWKKNGILLSNVKGNWLYSADIYDYLKKEKELSLDSLEFNFVIQSGDHRDLPNEGWETIAARRVPLSEIESRSPIFTYNTAYVPKETFRVTFTVGMRDQETLGFFKPQDGDRVIVSGNFCNWSPQGVALHRKGDGIYSRKITLRLNPNDPFRYLFRVVASRKALIPNRGWETVAHRQAALSAPTIQLPFAEFNGVRRAARFIINPAKWEQEGIFQPMKGDILQIRLMFDGKPFLSDRMFRVNKHRYETAIEVPLSVRHVRWQVVENMKHKLTHLRSVDASLNGVIVRN